MLYYTNDIDAEKFILNYEIKDNKIVIHLASGDIETVQCDSYSLIETNFIMEEQVRKAAKTIEVKEKNTKNYKGLFETYLSLSIVSVVMVIIASITGKGFPLTVASLTITSEMTTAYRLVYIYEKRLLNDLKKNDLLLKNKIALNDGAEKPNILSHIKEETKKQLTSKEGKPVFTLNTIDHMSLEELKQILANLELSTYFNYDDSPKAEPAKTLTKNRSI